jgi:beta-glucosidase
VGPTASGFDVLLGNYNGFAPRMATLFEGIVAAVSPGVQVNYSKGCEAFGEEPIRGDVGFYAPQADVIVACLGYTPALEGEEGDAQTEGKGDRVRIGLPGRQLELLQKLKETGKPVVLVLTGGSPIELNWAAENVPAILMAWYPGERGGEAVADVLFGRYNPSGRLPLTFVKSLDQVPPFTDYAMRGRTYRFMQEAPLYRFGYGLSYTTFTHSKLRMRPGKIRAGEVTEVSVDVRNAGSVAGDVVVQLYVSDVEASVPVPRVHLEGFQRVHLKPGEKKRVRFTLTSAQLACYTDDGRPFVEPGEFRVSVGGGQPDDPASRAVSAMLRVV